MLEGVITKRKAQFSDSYDFICSLDLTNSNLYEQRQSTEGGCWKGCENVRNKELVVYSYEQRRMETTFKGGQDSYRVVEPMMMMTMNSAVPSQLLTLHFVYIIWRYVRCKGLKFCGLQSHLC
jgi:hypothetical protein